MGPLQRLFEIELGPADDDLLLEGQVLVQDAAQTQAAGLALVVHQGEHIHGEGRLQGGLGVEPVQNDLGVGVLFQLNDDAHAVSVGLVAQVGDALEALVLDLIGNVLDQTALVDLIGQLGHDDADPALAVLLKFRASAHEDPAPAGRIGGADAGAAQDDALGREIRALDVLHDVGKLRLGVVQDLDAGVNDLAQVVGRDVGRHADRDARRAVHQQVREAGGQDLGLLPGLVEVRDPVDDLLVDVAEHLVGDLRHSGLGVTVGRRGVAVDGAEVAVSLDQPVAHGEVLRQTHHGVVDGGVAVGMVAADDVAHAGRRLAKGLVRGQVVLIEGIENAPMHRLETVAHVGQGPVHDDGHRIFHKGGFHFLDQIVRCDRLIGEQNILRLVITIF